ncbi:MAG: DUF1501 domain-containing protein [Planctomycetota bacterium]
MLANLKKASAMRHNFLRRKFLGTIAGGTAVLGVDALAPSWFAKAAHAISPGQERVLVVIQLSGGNDGLNTLVPLGNDDYYKARPTLAISAGEAIPLNDSLGLHPSLSGAAELFEDTALSVIQGVGYENPNRSHFESMDIWHSCGRNEEVRSEGWLGRALAEIEAAKEDASDVPALHLGDKKQPLALRSSSIQVPSIRSIDEFKLAGNRADRLQQLISDVAEASALENNDLLGFIRSSSATAMMSSERVGAATSTGKTIDGFPDSALAKQLSVVSQLIEADLPTRIYYLELDGFDTHSQQAAAHASLLRDWSEALVAFMRRLGETGDRDRVAVLTFSEFGRRVQENASKGTDHGAAAPVIIAGGGIKNQIIGTQPSLTDLQDGDLRFSIDFRRVYATLLQDWLQVDSSQVLPTQETAWEPLSVYRA